MYMYTMLDIFLSLSLVLSTETTTMAAGKSIHFFITKTNYISQLYTCTCKHLILLLLS